VVCVCVVCVCGVCVWCVYVCVCVCVWRRAPIHPRSQKITLLVTVTR